MASDRWIGAGLLGLALVLGGGSLLFPTERMVVEVAGAGVLAWRAARGWRGPTDWWTAAAVLLCLLILLLPLAQLIPLPAPVWSALPGRDDPARIMRAAGLFPRAFPVSLQPDETRSSAFFLLPPIGMFLLTLQAPVRDRVFFGWVVVGGALAGALLGITQAGSDSGLYLYDTAHRGAALGFFANKNHHADLLLIAMLLAAALTRASAALGLRAPSPLAAAGLIVVLAATLVAANSRMGLLLLPVALLPSLMILAPPGLARRAPARTAAAVGALALAAVVVGANSGVLDHLIARFSDDTDARTDFWPDVVYAVRHYMPVGSGLGTFVAVFQRDERIADVSFTYLPHAHDDYLEIALEAGIAGVALIGAGVLLWLVAGWRVLRRPAWTAFMPVHLACLAGFVVLLAHSVVDYPLRTLSLACVFGFLAGCMGPAPAGTTAATGAGSVARQARPRFGLGRKSLWR